MPRKTRKQKILTSTRKTQSPISPFTYHISNIDLEEKKVQNQPTVDIFPKEYIIKDLIKTLALSTLAILFELVLYWRLR